MKLHFYTIYDKKLEAYHQPWILENNNVALRQFQDLVTGDTAIAKHPEDYSIWLNGSFETTTGEIESIELELLAKAHEFVI